MLGGCSSINAMMYTHGAPSDYDEWNLDGWRYNDLKPYFRKAENFTPHIAHPMVDKTHRGDEGHWRTGYSYITVSETRAFGAVVCATERGIVGIGLGEAVDRFVPGGRDTSQPVSA
jgi:choline dehydrogenase-like flavoprotein